MSELASADSKNQKLGGDKAKDGRKQTKSNSEDPRQNPLLFFKKVTKEKHCREN